MFGGVASIKSYHIFKTCILPCVYIPIESSTRVVSDHPPPKRYKAKWDVGQYNHELLLMTK